ncbi:hypothetical protein EVAR_58125_1 [Eumeta japonica]|uniref:Pre-C2HC domain-containing protein n=1 Tax=Eumeta variegata TaxID=151549 RepID=A0A4C1YVM5_EUMVA|nr:hypothetical protein EVAR_58125_1 [Eumeta japonica]
MPRNPAIISSSSSSDRGIYMNCDARLARAIATLRHIFVRLLTHAVNVCGIILDFLAPRSLKLYRLEARARNTLHGIKITVDSISDFRSLNSLLIKYNFPFHTYALGKERKIKAVLRNIPLEIPMDCIKSDFKNQIYPLFAAHRMHRRDGTKIGLVLAVLHKSDTAKDIFKFPPRICGLSGITVEAPYRNRGPEQCFRCQLYSHAAIVMHSPTVSNAANVTR